MEEHGHRRGGFVADGRTRLVAARREADDWAPLKLALPTAWLPGWMLLCCVALPHGSPLRVYKHGVTRRSLHLRVEGGELEAWRYTGRGYACADLEQEVAAACEALREA